MDIEFTPEQLNAVDGVMRWLHNGNSPWFSITGYAGTGKTTILASIQARLRESRHIAYCAYTGKAAAVLREKLGGGVSDGSTVSTIHSIIYTPLEREDGTVLFKKVEDVPYDLFIVDEASMLCEELFSDLLSYGKPVLLIGDPGQLPPINGELFKPLQHPDVRLTKVFRQALDNPIIKIATDVRTGNKLELGTFRTYSGMAKVIRLHSSEEDVKAFMKASTEQHTTLLCYYNRTRSRYNSGVRDLTGHKGFLPEPGEKVVCLRNNRISGVWNGETYTVESTEIYDPMFYWVRLVDVPGKMLACIDTLNNGSHDSKIALHGEIKEYIKKRGDPLQLDFGYSLSVHKSQGSEWNNVMLFNEHCSKETDELHRMWLYTGITRARKNLLLVV